MGKHKQITLEKEKIAANKKKNTDAKHKLFRRTTGDFCGFEIVELGIKFKLISFSNLFCWCISVFVFKLSFDAWLQTHKYKSHSFMMTVDHESNNDKGHPLAIQLKIYTLDRELEQMEIEIIMETMKQYN